MGGSGHPLLRLLRESTQSHTEPPACSGKPLGKGFVSSELPGFVTENTLLQLRAKGKGKKAMLQITPQWSIHPGPLVHPVWLCLSCCLVPCQVSESLVQRNGDFLIRDSLTSLGDYVLTCRWRNEPLHFKINKVTVKSSEGHTRVQYLFEQESFDNVPALVRFYVGNRKAISEQSGAIVYCPINRTFPLRYLEASYGLANGKHGGPHSPATQKGGHIKRRSITMTDGLTADKITRAEGCPTR